MNLDGYWQLFDSIQSTVLNTVFSSDEDGQGVTGLIIASLTNKDLQLRQNAENSLMLIRSSCFIRHVEDILKAIISSEQNELKYLIPYSSSLFRSMKSTDIPQQDNILLQMLSLLFRSMQNINLTENQMKILASSIPHLIELSFSEQEPDWFLLCILREAEKKFQYGQNDRKEIFIGLCIVKECLLEVFQNEQLREILLKLLLKMFNILDVLQQQVFQIILSFSSLESLEGSLAILEMVLQILTISIQRIQNQKSDLVGVFLENQKLIQFFEIVLQFNFNTALRLREESSSLGGISLITFAVGPQQKISTIMLNLVNGIKYNAMKSLVTMHQYYLQQERDCKISLFDTSKIANQYSTFLQKFSQILILMCQQLNLSLTPQDQEYLDTINVIKSRKLLFLKLKLLSSNLTGADKIQILLLFSYPIVLQIRNSTNSFLPTTESKNQKQHSYSNSLLSIFNQVLLSLICNGKRDYESFSNDTDEFISLEKDLYLNRESDILKSNGCDLLYRLSENIDGFLSYAINFACKIIDASFNQNNLDAQFQDHLKQYSSSLFQLISLQNHIETVLLILIVLSPLSSQRKDLLKMIELCLKRNFSSNLVKVSGIARMRCSSLITHYSIYLFVEYDKQAKLNQATNADLLSEMMIFLVQQLKESSEQGGIEVAADSLWRLINSDDLKGCVENVIAGLLETLIQLINVCSNKTFFEFLEKIIRSYHHMIKNYAAHIIKNLAQRVIFEQKNTKGKNWESNLLIQKCVSCVTQFTKGERIMEDFYIYFEEDIVSLLKFLDNLGKILILKNILFILKNSQKNQDHLFLEYNNQFFIEQQFYQKSLNEFEETIDIISRNLQNLYKKNDSSVSSDSFFELLVQVLKSQYLMYDKQFILCGVFRIGIESITKLNIQSLSYEYSDFIKSCFLLQLSVQYCHEIFLTKEKLYEDVVLYLINIFPTITTQQFFPLKYIQIFLLLFYYQPFKSITAALNSNIIPPLLISIQNTYITKHITNPYDRKILIAGLISLIQNWKISNLNENDLFMIFKMGLQTLDQNKTEGKKEEKYSDSVRQLDQIAIKRPMFNDDETWLQSQEDPSDLYDITISDVEYERLNNFYYKPERDFYPIIKKFNPPVLESDEYSMFKQMVINLKKQDNQLISMLESKLNEQETKLYNSIINAQIIPTSDNEFQLRQIKKIKKKQIFSQISYPKQQQQQQSNDFEGIDVEGK